MPGAACVSPQRWPGRATLRKGGPEGPGGKNIKNILIYFSLIAPGKILKLQATSQLRKCPDHVLTRSTAGAKTN